MQGKSQNRTATPEDAGMDVEARLAQLTSSMRRWRMVTTLLLLAGIGQAGWWGYGRVRPQPVRGSRFEAIDEHGHIVAIIEATRSGGELQLKSGDGRPLVLASPDEAGDGIVKTYNAKGIVMVGVHTTPTGGAVALFNNLGREVVGLQSNKANCGSVLVRDVDGATREGLSGSRRYH